MKKYNYFYALFKSCNKNNKIYVWNCRSFRFENQG